MDSGRVNIAAARKKLKPTGKRLSNKGIVSTWMKRVAL
jgi:hypothetical protein